MAATAKNDTINKMVSTNTVVELTATNDTLPEQLNKSLAANSNRNCNFDRNNGSGGAGGRGSDGGRNKAFATTTPRHGQTGVTQMPIAGHVDTS